MIPGLAWRMLRGVHPRCLWHFLYTFGWKGFRAIERFKRAKRRGTPPVPFPMISLTDRCNLRCVGCWVSSHGTGRTLPVEDVHRIIHDSKARGVHFFGLLGGEPLLHPALVEIVTAHRDCYFQIFTNGALLDAPLAQAFRKAGNVTPLISIEGLEAESDARRGGRGVYAQARAALAHCREAGLVTGVATSVCRSNLAELASESFVQEVAAAGAHYLWYYMYRPVGERPEPERALTKEEIQTLRRFLVEIRHRAPLLIVDAYWDHDGHALCPAAMGLSHHIGPDGSIEPCPPLQCAVHSIHEDPDTVHASPKMEAARELLRTRSRGCILLEDPHLWATFMQEQGWRDTTGRGTFIEELRAMHPLPGHDMGAEAIPETHWFYRFAKRNWFFGFGAYG